MWKELCLQSARKVARQRDWLSWLSLTNFVGILKSR